MHHAIGAAFVVAALLNLATAVIAWRQRSATPAATALAAAAACLAFWSAVAAPQNLDLPRGVHDVLLYVSFPGILGAVVSMNLLARVVADPHHRPGRLRVLHLVGVPLAILVAVATDPWHHLVFSRISPLAGPPWWEDQFGPVFWAHTAWCYLVLGEAYLHLGRAWWRGSELLRAQVTPLILAGLVPLVGNLVVVGGTGWFAGQDLTPLFFTLTALLEARALLRNGLLRVVPVARTAVLETVPDHVVVVDDGGVVVDVNPAGRAYLRERRPDLPEDPVGLRAEEFLTPRALGDLPGGAISYTLEHRPGFHIDVRVTAITDRRGRSLGRVVVARDITELVQARRRLEEQVVVVEALRARLAEDAVRDPLTGLHNRRHFEPTAAELIRGASAAEPTGILVVDIDHFKRINDTHGHAAGDTVLVAVASVLAGASREGDLLARTGGEEFALVLPGADREVVATRAEELRAACAALAVPVGDGLTVRPTISIGTSTASRPGAEPADVLAAADRALYAAKAGGRDRVAAG